MFNKSLFLNSGMTAMTRISIICENTVGRPIPALGEHGFACLLETGQSTWLFDTGRGECLLHNLAVLGHDLDSIKGVILSHGHNDHTGGLKALLQKIGTCKVVAHPGVFTRRYWQGVHERREISIPFEKADLVACGADFDWRTQFSKIDEKLFYTGVIPRRHNSECGDPHLVCCHEKEPGHCPDPFTDDAAVAVETARGLVIVLGCAHSGLINTVEYIRDQCGNPPIHALLGGTHLGPASEEQFEATIRYLDTLQFDRLGVSHCTGQLRSAQLYARYPNKVFFANVGSVLEVSDEP